MTTVARPKVFGTGLIALDLVIGPDPETPVRSWAGGTCGNVLSILAYLGWDAYPVARMNDDVASGHVRADMQRWGVHLDWADCAPTAHTPIIVQEIRRRRDGRSDHRFSWSCPRCGERLPPFKAITVDAVEKVKSALADASVFFLDHLSRGTLALAAEASAHGALVAFEPSGKSTDKLLAEAIALAHIVKYADHRLVGIRGVVANGSAVLLEVQTLGDQGLRYRHRLHRDVSRWMHLKAVPAPRLADTCGAGDWCTAGLIAKAAVGGQEGFRRAGARGVRAALRYGQALAAWNCGFEGARGGMYVVSRQAFESQIASLINGRLEVHPKCSDGNYSGHRLSPARPVCLYHSNRAKPRADEPNGQPNDDRARIATKASKMLRRELLRHRLSPARPVCLYHSNRAKPRADEPNGQPNDDRARIATWSYAFSWNPCGSNRSVHDPESGGEEDMAAELTRLRQLSVKKAIGH